MKTKTWLILVAVLVFGISLRIFNFNLNPPSLYWDEVAIGLDAKAIANTGYDQHGNSFLAPLLSSYGDYTAPV